VTRGSFDYDGRQAPSVRIAGTETRDGVSIHDVEYAAPMASRSARTW
jgi:hypothetical protein